jgi:hypothetical protein
VSSPQNTIAIVYDYDQTLSPSYMQDEVVFPAFGIKSEIFWRRCSELVRDHGYDNELAYMKVLLDQLEMDRPTNEELKKLGAKLNFYQGLLEMFEEFLSLARINWLALGNYRPTGAFALLFSSCLA